MGATRRRRFLKVPLRLAADVRAVTDPFAQSPFLARPEEPQVFVDASGRRERRVRCALAAAVAVSAMWLGGLALGAVGFQGLPALSAIQAHAPAHSDLAVRRTSVLDREAVARQPARELRHVGEAGV